MKMGFEKGVSDKDKLSYLARMQIILSDKIMMMEKSRFNRLSTVNLTISVKERIVQFMFDSGDLTKLI